jgi:hypothetical protein
MPTQMVQQKIFTYGEVDAITWKRTDINEYLNCAQSLLNCEIGTTGLVRKRKGTSYAINATGYAQFNSRMYEFIDKHGNYYIVLAAANNFYVFTTEVNQKQVITIRNNNVILENGNFVVINSDQLVLVQTIPVPYATSDLDNMDYTQDNDTLLLSNPNFPPARIYITSYGSPFPTFAYQYLDIYPLPAYDFNTINYNAFTVALSVSGNVLTFQFTGLSGDPGFNNAWIGGQIIGGGSSDLQPIGYAIITAVSYSGGTTTFTATIQIPFQTTNYATQGSQYSIRQPAWSVTLGYPAKIAFFQNRLWLANTATLRSTIFGSVINTPVSFDVGIGNDSDAIVYSIGQNNSGAIEWLNGGKQLEIYCDNEEFACPQDVNSGLTPASFSIRQQSSYGASSLMKPVTYLNDSYFLTRAGQAFINFHFNGIGLTYVSSNISAQSNHLVKQPTNRALLRGSDTSQDNFIYFLNPNDDTITAFQFAAEYKLAALTPIEFQDNVQLIDIATINNVVHILKYYQLTQQYTIETFDDTQYVDGAFLATMNSAGVVTGLSLLNGYTVQVVFQDQDYGQYLVTGGTITVYNPNGVSGNVTIGLLYDVEITPMYFYATPVASPFKKYITRIYVDYYNSLDFYINDILVPYQTYDNIMAGEPLMPMTDTAIIDPVLGYDRFSTFSITQSSPFPLVITGLAYQVEASVI